jgi:serine/threonine-protein kinase
MRPLRLLKGLGKALARHAGNAVGFGQAGDLTVGVGEEVWKEWSREGDEQQRHDEVAAVVHMAAAEFRRQVADVIREVAAGQPQELGLALSRQLQEVPDKLRQALRRPDDPEGRSVPPGLSLRDARDLVSLLTRSPRAAAPRGPAPVTLVPPPARVTLTLAGGEAFVFEERTTCIIGRADECNPRFPRDQKHRTISRHHCLFDVNPPDVCVRDLGSLGGTFVNGELLDKRPEGMSRDEALMQRFRERDLKDGDELKLCQNGAAVFRVSVTVSTLCMDCGAWIPDDRKAGCERSPGVYQCETCRSRAAAAQRPRAARPCALCGRDVSGEAGTNRPGEFLCSSCRNDPEKLMRDLRDHARAGDADVVVIKGYTILKELGRGGMGSVWLARHDQTGRFVAIKVMLPRVAADQRCVTQFLREMDVTRVLDHPNVVRLQDAGYSRGTFFIILDYCEGGSVADLAEQRGGTLPLAEAVEITLQALEGLHYAHNVHGPGRGLVHRDLKPGNLFLSGAGSGRVARVGDYGLAKAFDDAGLGGVTRTGDVAGTPLFMPRRQVIDFKYAKPEMDVWSLAASLYHLLTGAPARDFPPGQDPWLVILETPAVPIRRRNPAIPKQLAAVIDKALVEEPDIPFQSAAAFKEALEGAVALLNP